MQRRHALLAAILYAAASWVNIAGVNFAWADEADESYAVAAGHYDRQEWAPAAEKFRAFLDRHPQHAQAGNATFYLGMTHLQRREFNAARQQFAACRERPPEGRKAIEAEFRVGEVGFFLDDREVARRDLASFREKFPDDSLNAYAVPYLADLALKSKLVIEADSLYRAALKEFPTGPKQDACRFGLAQALEAQGKFEEPTLIYAALAAKSGPLAEQALYHLGNRRYADGQHAAAVEAFEQFEAKYPTGRLLRSARFGKACALARQKKHDAARALFESLTADAQFEGEARFWLGALHKERRDWDAAAATFLAGARNQPDCPRCAELLFHAADSLRMAGKHDEAVKRYDELLRRWPKHALAADCWQGKLRVADARGEHEQIATLAKRIAQDFPGRPLHLEAERRLARSLLEMGKPAAAVEILAPLLDKLTVESHRGEAQQLLAESYLQLGQLTKAQAALEPLLEGAAPTELRAEAQYTLGRLLMAQHKYGQAIASLEAFLATQPPCDRAAPCRAELPMAYAQTGQVEKAIAAHNELVAEHGAQIAVLSTATLRLADTFYASQRYPEAESLYRTLAIEPRHDALAAEGWSGLGWSQYQAGLLPLATESFAKLLEQSPKHALAGEAALARAQILEKLQKPEEAATGYELVIAQFSTPQRLAKALLGAAQLHGQLGRPEQAIEHYRRLLKECPDVPQPDAVRYQLAWALHDGKQAAPAEAEFLKIVREHRGSRFWGDAAFRAANAAFTAGRHEEATRLVDELMSSRPQGDVLAHALLLQGRIAVAQRKWPAAHAPLRKLAESFPDHALCRTAEYLVAEAAFQQGQYEEACRLFAALATRLEGQTESWVELAPLRHAQALANLQKWTEAQQVAEKLAGGDAQHSQRHEIDYVLGRCLAGQAQFQQARAAYERVTSSKTGGETETAAMARWMIGETYFHQKDYRAALREYLLVEARYTFPKWRAAGLLQAGKCCEQLGHHSLAIKYYQRVVSEFGDTEFRAEAEKRLRTAQRKPSTTR